MVAGLRVDAKGGAKARALFSWPMLVLPLVATVATCTAPRRAWADDAKQACVTASDAGQSLMAEKKLRAARKQLLVCAAEGCPGIVKEDCAGWLAQVTTNLPTVVVVATDVNGNELTAVKVSFDGEVLVDHLDGSAIPVDPGLHAFHYEGPGGAVVDASITVREGEKNRTLKVSFPTIGTKTMTPPPPPPTPAPVKDEGTRKIPTVSWVLGGVGVVALGSFAYFGLKGRSDVQHLRDTCAPACDSSDEKPAKTKLLVADVSLAVGIVSLGFATYFAITAKSEQPAATATLSFDAAALPGGGVGFVGGRF